MTSSSRFVGRLEIAQVGWLRGRAEWRTLAPLGYRSALLGTTIVVPAEFDTDLASVPRVPLAWLIAGGKGSRSGVVHDFAYQWGYWCLPGGGTVPVDRKLADAVFRESLAADDLSGAGPGAQRAMWLAVRLLGGDAWRPGRARRLNPQWSDRGVPAGQRLDAA